MPDRCPRGAALLRILVAACLLIAGADAADSADTALPVPRFVSLRVDEVNLRAGPGERYPIEWVLTRRGLPVEIVEEFDVWRKIRDSQGSEGWVHQRMVTGTRTIIVTGGVRTLHADPDAGSPAVARAQPGVIAQLLECRGLWCRVAVQSIRGWLKRNEIWGVLPNEVVR